MKIKFIEISNFRKLKACRVAFADKETIFVGANNSGKTSAMDALITFLKDKAKFTTREFTLTNWREINAIGELWSTKDKPNEDDLSIDKWELLLPSIDLWLEVGSHEIHHVHHLIPTLGWKGGLLGLRLRLEPKSMEELHKEFYSAVTTSVNTTKEAAKKKTGGKLKLKLWPATMWDFLEQKLLSHFDIRSYVLDPTKLIEPKNGVAIPQSIKGYTALEGTPLSGLIKIDIINAQRGFTDQNADAATASKLTGNLSTQLREYYKKHLNPVDQPGSEDIAALESLEEAKESFDTKLKESFKEPLKELEGLNYPGFGSPSINISSKVSAIDGLNHESAVQFNVLKETGVVSATPLSLPEKYNGLGYQNLISMVFKLIRFRDDWMKIGKSYKATVEESEFEPLHLVLVEEPEAHLHAQVQQVFIRKAYDVLRNSTILKEKGKDFTTQLVVSTHSSHVAHEIDFTSLRYFRRMPPVKNEIATSTVVNLSTTFGTENDTTRFAIRYLKTTHCDLFFADAAILVEGPAERMLVPHFIQNHFSDLTSSYLTLLEIGGSHAHKLRPLIEDLGLITLIITDVDTIDVADNRKSVQPAKGKSYQTGNSTIKTWVPAIDKYDDLMKVAEMKMQVKDQPVRVAFQMPIQIEYGDAKSKKIEECLPYTFEDALVLENLELFKKFKGTGLLKKMNDASQETNIQDGVKAMYTALSTTPKKAEFALELIFIQEPQKLKVPSYIANGLKWLIDQLKERQSSITI